jgi:hypothetical protein
MNKLVLLICVILVSPIHPIEKPRNAARLIRFRLRVSGQHPVLRPRVLIEGYDLFDRPTSFDPRGTDVLIASFGLLQ